jgi:hypothetical protein
MSAADGTPDTTDSIELRIARTPMRHKAAWCVILLETCGWALTKGQYLPPDLRLELKRTVDTLLAWKQANHPRSEG